MSTEMNADAGHKRTVVATEHAYAADLRLHLRDAADRQQDFIMAPLFAPVAPRGASDESGRDGHDVRRQAAGNTPETALSNSQWMSDVVASHAGAAGAGAACHERGGQGSMDYMDCFWLNGLEEELEWASYVGVQAYVGPPPATPVSKAGTGTGASHLPMYAQTVRTSLDRLAGYVQFWLTIPLVSAESASAVHNGEDCFLQWDAFRSLTDYHPRVGVAVQLPEGRGTDSQNSCNELGIDAHWIPPPGFLKGIQRWRAEPVKCIRVPCSLFVTNTQGVPVLPPLWAAIVKSLSLTCATLCLTGVDEYFNSFMPGTAYVNALRYYHITAQQEAAAALCPLDQAEAPYYAGYHDRLQMPLQPLRDHLEAATYETFERDKAKYLAYYHAMLQELQHAAVLTTDCRDYRHEDYCPVVTVVGAGRGPLVGCVLDACLFLGCGLVDRVKIFAVEKNPSAVHTLRGRFGGGEGRHAFAHRPIFPTVGPHNGHQSHLGAEIVNKGRGECEDVGDGQGVPHMAGTAAGATDVLIAAGRVVVVAGDMRQSRSSVVQPADVLVSELLGSWGDNELSPECIEGAISQGYLKAGTGRSVPCSYTSYLSPVMAAPQWMRARGMMPPSLSAAPGVMCGAPGLETPYVCYLHDYLPVGSEEPVFIFKHQCPPSPSSAQSLEGSTSTSTSTGTSTLAHFRRRSCVSWTVDAACSIHGFEGTFDSVLSATCHASGDGASDKNGKRALDVTPNECDKRDSHVYSASSDVPLSITRKGRTPGMYSWFSLFLPLGAPVRCTAGSRVEATVWRCADGRRVWYEWCLTSPITTPIQNPNGRTYSIGL